MHALTHACTHRTGTRINTDASARGRLQTRRISIFRRPSCLPAQPPRRPVLHSHVIDALAKTPSIFRAHGSAICSTHKRMTSLQVVCNIERESALNSPPLLLQRKRHAYRIVRDNMKVDDPSRERKREVAPKFSRAAKLSPSSPSLRGDQVRSTIERAP